MGNLDSKAKFEHGQMMLHLDKLHFTSGQYLTGRIYLQLDQPYPAVAVSVCLNGKESYSWGEGKHDNPYQDPNSTFVKKAIENF